MRPVEKPLGRVVLDLGQRCGRIAAAKLFI
jgi:hypothetical protein